MRIRLLWRSSCARKHYHYALGEPEGAVADPPDNSYVESTMSTGLLVLGNQLFDPGLLKPYSVDRVFMREDTELCTYFKFHKLKIIFFLGAMRAYAQELKQTHLNLTYQELGVSDKSYEEHLLAWIKRHAIRKLIFYEIEDKFFQDRILKLLQTTSLEIQILPSPMFLTTREQFQGYLAKNKRPFMKTFYESQRRRLRILLDSRGEPEGGRWTFDELNRKPLPKKLQPAAPHSEFFQSEKVTDACEAFFSDHPGDAANLWLPVDRPGAKRWLKDFIDRRLDNFGPYEDALTERSDFVYHSALTPFLNCGLLTPQEVIHSVLAAARLRKVPIASVEGFIRQVIGWREFIRGIYQHYSEIQETRNFWGHHRKLSPHWYEANTGIYPLDQVIRKVLRLGYAHHIERLMVVGNLMLLLEIDPREAHRWFMEMFIDSSDWVMGPNVYGMGICSDGGIFATKPYICGSNYYLKMGGYPKGPWCDAVDGLYWSFIEKHQIAFSKNPRMSMMVASVKRMDETRKKKIFAAADELRTRLTAGAV